MLKLPSSVYDCVGNSDSWFLILKMNGYQVETKSRPSSQTDRVTCAREVKSYEKRKLKKESITF